jgi:hypothetical protein
MAITFGPWRVNRGVSFGGVTASAAATDVVAVWGGTAAFAGRLDTAAPAIPHACSYDGGLAVTGRGCRPPRPSAPVPPITLILARPPRLARRASVERAAIDGTR